MSTTTRRIAPWGLILSVLILIFLSACGSSGADLTPTAGVEEIFTAAYETFQAQQATELALTPPTPLASPTPFPTLPPPSPIATISFTTPTLSTGGTACDSSAFVKDITIPDDTFVDAGKKFDKTWELLNNGTCAWTTGYKLTFDSGDQMGGADTSITVPVPVGAVVDITVSMVAPEGAGTYKGSWRIKNAQGVAFGDTPWVQIKVGAATETTEP